MLFSYGSMKEGDIEEIAQQMFGGGRETRERERALMISLHTLLKQTKESNSMMGHKRS